MRGLFPVSIALVLCLSCVQSQPGGGGPRGGPPGPPPPRENAAGPPREGPGPPPKQFDASKGASGPRDGPSGGPPAAKPDASGNQSSNPWQDLLTRMMDLLSTGMGPKNLSKVPAEIVDPKQPPSAGSGPSDVPPPPKPLNVAKKPVIKDCFWEGRYYSPGSDIIRGQHDRWCYVTYCDSQGKIQFWDDYNCKPNSMRDTSSHNTGRDRWVPPGQRPSGGQPQKEGCNHKGQWYDANQDISSHRVGDRCYGSYCSRDSQVINWEDWCTNVNNVGATPSPGRAQNQMEQGVGAQGQGQTQGQGQGRGQNQGMGMDRQQFQGRGQGQGQGQGQAQGQRSFRRKQPTMGCFHGGRQYQPNEDVISGQIGDLCYGYYCEGDNVFVHWEDTCQHQNIVPMDQSTTPPPVPSTTAGFWGGFMG